MEDRRLVALTTKRLGIVLNRQKAAGTVRAMWGQWRKGAVEEHQTSLPPKLAGRWGGAELSFSPSVNDV